MEEASTVNLILLLSLFLCSLVFFILTRKKRTAEHRRKINLPPGPRGLPLIGNLHQIRQPLHHAYAELSKKYGPLVHLRFAGIPVLIVSSAETANEVLKTQDLAFCSRPQLVSLKKFSYNGLNIVFAPYGEQWRELRRIFLVELLNNKKITSFRRMREEEIALLIESIVKKIDIDGNGRVEINMSEFFQILTSTITCRMAFGKLDDDDEEEDGERSEFHESIEEFNSLGLTLFAEDLFSGGGAAAAARAFDRLRGLHRRLDKTFFYLSSYYDKVIEKHKVRQKRESKDGEWVERDVVDVLLRLHNERPLEFTKNHIKGALQDIFIGGTDTTAATATWALAELVNNSRAMKKVYEEFTFLVKKKTKTDEEKVVVVNEEDLVRLPYLKMVVKETLRLHPPVPLLVPRESMKAAKIDGYDVIPGTRIFVNAWAMGRDPKYWKNPDEFSPERFDGDDGAGSAVDYKGQHFQYLPFGSGRRICPGMQFGVVMVELALANLLAAFKWEVPNGVKGGEMDMEETSGIAISKKQPLILNVSKRL